MSTPQHTETRPWPNPADSALDRARRIAQMYRAHLADRDQAAADGVDQLCATFGEAWMTEKPDDVDEHAQLTTAQAAELVHVTIRRIRDWAQMDHPDKPGKPLLPRFNMVGRERTYIAAHVLAAASRMKRAHPGS